MPHITVEYSANLERRIDPGRLVRAAHEAAAATGTFKIGGIRSRAARRDVVLIADGDPDNAFVAVEVRIGSGRSPEVRRSLGGAIFEAVGRELEAVFADAPLAISLEVVEIDETAAFRRNNLHARLAAGTMP